MPILISDKRIDKAIARLVRQQPSKTSKQGLSTAMLNRVVEACRHDPRAWESIGLASSPTGDGATEHGASASIRVNTPNSSRPAMSKPEASGDQSSPTQRANAA